MAVERPKSREQSSRPCLRGTPGRGIPERGGRASPTPPSGPDNQASGGVRTPSEGPGAVSTVVQASYKFERCHPFASRKS